MRLRYVALFSLAVFIALTFWLFSGGINQVFGAMHRYGLLVKEDAQSKQFSRLFLAALDQAHKQSSSAPLPALHELATSHRPCFNSFAAPQRGRCLLYVIEAPTMAAAQRAVQDTASTVRRDLAQRPPHELRSSAVAFVPAVRTDSYTGGVTPHAFGKHFEGGTPVVVQLGE